MHGIFFSFFNFLLFSFYHLYMNVLRHMLARKIIVIPGAYESLLLFYFPLSIVLCTLFHSSETRILCYFISL